MDRYQTGFSLIEALVSLLVLSIGLLGLGQLQARLSVASLNQASAAYARLLQDNLYEKTMSYEISGIAGSSPESDTVATPSTLYTVQLTRSATENLAITGIALEWTDLDSTRTEIITSTLSTYPSLIDTRWLLTSPLSPDCPC